jgi:hypothetical protein
MSKYYISTKRPKLKEDAKDIRVTRVTHNDEKHGIMDGEKTERFSELKKRLLKKTV